MLNDIDSGLFYTDNSYLNADTYEKLYFISGKDFEPEV